MTENMRLTSRFEEVRPHLRAVAYRMLGSPGEADDAVQETWLRLNRSDVRDVENLAGWLTTVVSRVCLDMLRSRAIRRDGGDADVLSEATDIAVDVEGDAQQTDAVGAALLTVLDTLTPAERLAFVLHDSFGVSFDEIAPIVERTPEATRQLASRARRRVRGGGGDVAAERRGGGKPVERGGAAKLADPARQREVVEAFLAASRKGEFDRLLELLDPDVVLRADRVAVEAAQAAAAHGAPPLLAVARGAGTVAGVFSGRARAVKVALIDGAVGAAYAPGGKPYSVFRLEVVDDRIVAIDVVADTAVLAGLDIELP
jgi:RNA polymerase sigma factor (sigma-70 family)